MLTLHASVFATYTSYILIQFKLRHPQVHSMGDAGYLLFGWPGRELFAFGTFAFAIFAAGSQLVAGQDALASLSDSKLCSMVSAVHHATVVQKLRAVRVNLPQIALHRHFRCSYSCGELSKNF